MWQKNWAGGGPTHWSKLDTHTLRQMIALCVLLAALSLMGAGADAEMVVAATDTTFVQRAGRTFPYTTAGNAAAVGMSYLGGGFRLNHNGTILTATLGSDAGWFKVATYQSNEGFMPFQSISWIPSSASGAPTSLVAGVGPGSVTILLNVAPQYWETQGGSAFALNFSTNGFFLPPPKMSRTIHFLGDSITAATNIHGGFPGCGDGGYESDYASSWAGILCNFFSADCSTVAVGGKGLVKNCCGQGGSLMPDFYQQDRMSDQVRNFAFNDTRPDAVVVYLGTNDFYDGVTPALEAAFSQAYLDFMYNVTHFWYGTKVAPALDIAFFATIGPMLPLSPANATRTAVAIAQLLGYNVHLLDITTACNQDLSTCLDGCATHPGVASHRSMARLAAPVISATMGWPMSGVL